MKPGAVQASDPSRSTSHSCGLSDLVSKPQRRETIELLSEPVATTMSAPLWVERLTVGFNWAAANAPMSRHHAHPYIADHGVERYQRFIDVELARARSPSSRTNSEKLPVISMHDVQSPLSRSLTPATWTSCLATAKAAARVSAYGRSGSNDGKVRARTVVPAPGGPGI